jgi:hypothetical protein
MPHAHGSASAHDLDESDTNAGRVFPGSRPSLGSQGVLVVLPEVSRDSTGVVSVPRHRATLGRSTAMQQQSAPSHASAGGAVSTAVPVTQAQSNGIRLFWGGITCVFVGMGAMIPLAADYTPGTSGTTRSIVSGFLIAAAPVAAGVVSIVRGLRMMRTHGSRGSATHTSNRRAWP